MYCTNILCVHCTKPIVLSFLSFVCASLKGTLCSITSKYIWIYLHQCYFFHVITSLAPSVGQVLKHCQRHNGPRVLRDSTKLPKLGDVIAISNLKLSVLSPQSSVLLCYMYHSDTIRFYPQDNSGTKESLGVSLLGTCPSVHPHVRHTFKSESLRLYTLPVLPIW